MKIQQVERQTGISAQNIRFYEREGLILPQRDAENRYRLYTPEDVERLKTIAFCRHLGISIPDIRRMLQEECTFCQCVEAAMAEAKEAEAAAAARAELCRSVLRQLQVDPWMEPVECAGVVLRDRSVRKLYEQVLPPELRKPPRNRYWILYLAAVPVLLVGILLATLLTTMVQYRPNRNEMVDWLIDPQAVITFSCGEKAVQSDYGQGRLEMLLLDANPTAHLPWSSHEADPVTVTIQRESGTAVMTLWEYGGNTCLRWESPELAVEWTFLDRGCLMLYRQIRSEVRAAAE